MSSQSNEPNKRPPAPAPHELRRHPRRPEDRPAWIHFGSASFAVGMIDISGGGACFISPRPLPVARLVRLQVGGGTRSTETGAIVVRYTDRLDGTYSIGVRFLDEAEFADASRFPSRRSR